MNVKLRDETKYCITNDKYHKEIYKVRQLTPAMLHAAVYWKHKD